MIFVCLKQYALGFPVKENSTWCFFALHITDTRAMLQVNIYVVDGGIGSLGSVTCLQCTY